ncbi:MAG: polysaccharide deacetylase family protein [Coriobacteriales bacterium]|nr:polysaccharide deacetylase family protein [Coriobacteriales bacterium]
MSQATQRPRHMHMGAPEPPRRKSRAPLIITLLLLCAIAIAAVVFIFIYPIYYNVSVNGLSHGVFRGATIQTVLDQGYADPKPGNLLAIDGALLTEMGGDKFSATINGNTTNDASTPLNKDDVVVISDGQDATEDVEVTEEVIPHGDSSASTDAATYYAGSLHVNSPGQDGKRTTRTGKISGKTIVEDTVPAIDSGYRVYTANTGDTKAVALTFDDGPWGESTNAILDVFEQYGAKATFFTIGNQIANYPDNVKRAVSLGCDVLTHSYDHAEGSGQGVNLTYMSPEEQVNEIVKGYEAISAVTGTEPPHVIRAPGGNYYGDMIATLAPYVNAEIGWDVDTEDWRRPGSAAIVEAALSAQPGQVVLMHDGGGDRSQTVEAVRQIVPALIERGYQLVTVSELLQF